MPALAKCQSFDCHLAHSYAAKDGLYANLHTAHLGADQRAAADTLTYTMPEVEKKSDPLPPGLPAGMVTPRRSHATGPTSATEARRSLRAELVARLSALPASGSILGFQRALSDAILSAEGRLLTCDDEEARHLHLLRCIGDGLAWSLLPPHTIRTLNRHPGKPASLVSQGDDLAFVFSTADKLLKSGYWPILNDLTHLLRVGDMVAVCKDSVLVLECKNTPVPGQLPKSGRRARQRDRGERLTEYLRKSRGTIDDQREWIAISATLPEPEWSVLERAIESAVASSDGVSSQALGENDWLTALYDPSRFSVSAANQMFGKLRQAMKSPTVGIHTELLLEPSAIVESPMVYPVSAETKAALLESQLLLLRQFDLALFEADTLIHDTAVRLTVADPDAPYPLRATVGELDIPLSYRFLQQVSLSPVPVRRMRDALLQVAVEQAHSLDALDQTAADVQEAGTALAAPGDNITYGTIYRGTAGDPLAVFRLRDLELSGDTEDYVVRRVQQQTESPEMDH
jgi:hypothetical protein